MAWQEHFNETVPAILLDALRSTGRSVPLSGFGKSEDVGDIPKSLAEVIIDAAEQLWASQHQEGISRLSVSDVLHRVGVSDLNSTFARNLQRLLEVARDAITVNDERSITAIVERAKLRRRTDPRTSIRIGEPGEPCHVLGNEKRPLTDGQYAVISRLLKAGSDGLSKDAIEAVRPSARRILKTLRKDPDWAKVILMPGQTNGRYRLKM